MSEPDEIYVDARGPRRPSRLARLWPAGRALFAWPGLRLLRPLTRRVLEVAEPAGRLSLRSCPPITVEHPGDHLTVLSANLWHDWPRYRRWTERLEALAQLAETERADLVLLQEVARTRRLHADEWLAQRLAMAHVYSRANGHAAAIGFEEGLAVLSRFPLSAVRLRQLGAGRNPFVRRLALGAEAETPFGPVLAISVHLGLRSGRNAVQLTELRAWVGAVADGRPVVVGGDFNAPEHRAQIRHTQRLWLDTFRHLHPHADGTTHELRWPWGGLLRRHRLDYVFVVSPGDRWQVRETQHVDAPGGPHSDHRAVLTRITPAPAGA